MEIFCTMVLNKIEERGEADGRYCIRARDKS